jgi:hypothetical protein
MKCLRLLLVALVLSFAPSVYAQSSAGSYISKLWKTAAGSTALMSGTTCGAAISGGRTIDLNTGARWYDMDLYMSVTPIANTVNTIDITVLCSPDGTNYYPVQTRQATGSWPDGVVNISNINGVNVVNTNNDPLNTKEYSNVVLVSRQRDRKVIQGTAGTTGVFWQIDYVIRNCQKVRIYAVCDTANGELITARVATSNGG